MRTVHTRHEQGAAYMALGAALATGKPSAYAVVPGPGLLNSAAALLTAYSMNAPVLALIGEIPDADIGRHLGHLHEIRDQAGIIKRLVDYSALIRKPEQAPRLVAEAMRSMASGRPGPASLQCAIDVWGKSGAVTPQPPLPDRPPQARRGRDPQGREASGRRKKSADRLRRRRARRLRGSHALSAMLQAPVLGYRRGRGVLDSRDPLERHAAARPRAVGRGRRGAGHRLPHADPVPPMGHGQGHQDHPRSTPMPRSPAACTSPPSR